MFKGKSFDNVLKLSTYMFWLLAICSIGLTLYNKYMGYSESLDMKPTFTFMFFALFAKYQYAIQYWLNKLETINTKERDKKLSIDSDRSTD
ncbi:hypothetical protein EC844_11623 [Acinetobacter calcoaceticus]|uniref:Uncharacterized protein n=1 Tax=Acinetobacter calcoaceticus TaxID=471 RepID=A0A4R1XRX1_ACICA|nr:hypothetical protein EC844_11623 [Acinetobacter calcoaceticus]